MTRRASFLTSLVLLVAAPLVAGEVFPEVEYVSGRAGLNQKVKGQLILDERGVTFKNKDGADVFSLPIQSVTGATSSVNHDEGSFGRKMALGIFAGKTEEFLTVHTEGPQGAEAIMIKCKKHTSQGIADKIQFQAKHAAETAAR
jgi:hypothetical protein